jgi:hypothetical protein
VDEDVSEKNRREHARWIPHFVSHLLTCPALLV